MSGFELTAIAAEDVSVVARFISLAFATPPDQAAQWMERAGHQHIRVLREDGKAVACLLRVPMGQYFGGRVVGLMGIAGVAVPPEHRGRGYARRMMQMAMEGAAAEGFALGGLYASTQTLYRQIGFEQAAFRFRIEVPVGTLGVVERGGKVEALDSADLTEMKGCYARFAARNDGLLDRGDYIWNRIKSGRGIEYTPFGVRSASGELEGYFFLNQVRKPDTGRQNLELSDFVFNTESGGRRLLGLLADFGSMADEIGFFGGPNHPATLLLPQQRYRLTSKDTHLTRVLDIRRAIETRGFSPAVGGSVHLEIKDELIPANNGRFVVDVAGGKGNIKEGGRGAVKMDVRGFAAIYGGLVTPEQAGMLGWASGSAEDLARANVFGGTMPSVPDMY